jgi:hypothetical protein
MGKVTIILDTTTVTDSGDTEGTAVNCQLIEDEAGAVQFKSTAGTCDEVELQGRLHPDLGWVEIATSGALGSGTTEVLQTGVAILPQMRAVMKNASGATVKVALLE